MLTKEAFGPTASDAGNTRSNHSCAFLLPPKNRPLVFSHHLISISVLSNLFPAAFMQISMECYVLFVPTFSFALLLLSSHSFAFFFSSFLLLFPDNQVAFLMELHWKCGNKSLWVSYDRPSGLENVRFTCGTEACVIWTKYTANPIQFIKLLVVWC